MSRGARERKRARIASAAAIALALSAQATAAQTVIGSMGSANDQVYAVTRLGNTIYIGGLFTQVGHETGGGVPFDPVSGDLAKPFPEVNGAVLAALSDGSGGWYIGGLFDAVGGVHRANLAHILEDGSVGEWNPATGGYYPRVHALARSGNIVYVGGEFDSIGGKVRHRVAAVDGVSGEVTDWNPNLSGYTYDQYVYALAVSGGTVYVGGGFTVAGGQTRNRIAAIDAASGQPTAWNPNASATVYALAIKGGIVYAGGAFGSIGGQARSRIAALDSASGIATPWNPGANGDVRAILAGDGTLYVGGTFVIISGQVRGRIAELKATDGTATSWSPNANDIVKALAVRANTVYAGGGFSSIGGQPRTHIAALDATSGNATSWDPRLYANVGGGHVEALEVSVDRVYVGGFFFGVGARARNHIAALDATTGDVTDWDPNANSTVFALAASESTVYAGGYFGTIGGQSRPCLAALDAKNGHATAWNPGITGFNLYIAALAVHGNVIYAGGCFTALGGQSRTSLAALDATSGMATAWNPQPGQGNQTGYPVVEALAVDGGSVYVGGDFGSIGSQLCSGFAVIDETSGIATAWNGDGRAFIRTLAARGATVYVGGDFSRIGGQDRHCLAALDATSGLATDWDPHANDEIDALAVSGSTVYAGGLFTSIGGRAGSGFAALDAETGFANAWSGVLSAGGYVQALAASNGMVYAGGAFSNVGAWPRHSFFAMNALPEGVGVPWPLAVASFRLSGPMPNPVRATARIPYSLHAKGVVTLEVYDLQGRRVALVLDRSPQAAGAHEALIDTRGWRAGCYFCRLTVDRRSMTRALLVTR